MSDIQPAALVLAVEPDSAAAAVLRRVLDGRVRARLTVVESIDAALMVVDEQLPDVILTSTFLPPGDLARLSDVLRRREDAAHTQVITTPHFLEAPASDPIEDEAGRVLRFPRQRLAGSPFHCDPAVLRAQVEAYLEHARVLGVSARSREHQRQLSSTGLVLANRSLEPQRTQSAAFGPTGTKTTDAHALNGLLRPADRRRASRLRAVDLAGQWAVKLNVDGDARIVDISSTGIRLETATRLTAGRLVNVEVIGMEQTQEVWARLIRTEAIESGADVTYRSAAMFVRALDVFTTASGPIAATIAAESFRTPTALADLLGRVLSGANWVSNGPSLISRFEWEVCDLVRARDVRIRPMPIQTANGGQSLWFQVPGTADARQALHIVFERGHRPTAAEFRLLKAAASLAAVVLDLAQIGGMPAIH